MIENMDHDVGRVVQLLKAKGEYDNTLIIFLSDNGTSEPNALLSIHFSSADAPAVQAYLKMVNNTLSNLGNVSCHHQLRSVGVVFRHWSIIWV